MSALTRSGGRTPVVETVAIADPEPQQSEHRRHPDQDPARGAPVELTGHAVCAFDGRTTDQQEAPKRQAEDGDVDEGVSGFSATEKAKIA